MGWLFYGKSKAELVADLIRSETTEAGSRKVLAHCVRGNVLWSVVECTRAQDNCVKRYIGCDLLQKSGGEWGYKGMDESVHPFYYSCPLKYLDMVPDGNREWRDKVRAFHRKFKVGQKVELEHCSIPWAKIISLRPLLGTYEGSCYRLKRDLIGNVL